MESEHRSESRPQLRQSDAGSLESGQWCSFEIYRAMIGPSLWKLLAWQQNVQRLIKSSGRPINWRRSQSVVLKQGTGKRKVRKDSAGPLSPTSNPAKKTAGESLRSYWRTCYGKLIPGFSMCAEPDTSGWPVGRDLPGLSALDKLQLSPCLFWQVSPAYRLL